MFLIFPADITTAICARLNMMTIHALTFVNKATHDAVRQESRKFPGVFDLDHFYGMSDEHKQDIFFSDALRSKSVSMCQWVFDIVSHQSWCPKRYMEFSLFNILNSATNCFDHVNLNAMTYVSSVVMPKLVAIKEIKSWASKMVSLFHVSGISILLTIMLDDAIKKDPGISFVDMNMHQFVQAAAATNDFRLVKLMFKNSTINWQERTHLDKVEMLNSVFKPEICPNIIVYIHDLITFAFSSDFSFSHHLRFFFKESIRRQSTVLIKTFADSFYSVVGYMAFGVATGDVKVVETLLACHAKKTRKLLSFDNKRRLLEYTYQYQQAGTVPDLDKKVERLFR